MARRSADPDEAVHRLREGGVLIMPTDTLPGFHARADDATALARIRALKGRDDASPLLLLAADAAAVAAWTAPLDGRRSAYLRRCWPGPFTCILPASDRVPEAVRPGRGTAAFRVPAPAALRALLAAVGVPLVSTSVNRTGEPPARTMDEAAAAFGEAVDLVADAAWDAADGAGAASALLDLGPWPPALLREGPQAPPSWRN